MGIIDGHQVVSLHTGSGIQLDQWLPEDYMSLTWTRELRETTHCDITLPNSSRGVQLADLQPWAQWIAVWTANNELLWRGSVYDVTAKRDSLQIIAKDPSVWAKRTRIPVSKRWEAASPEIIAEDMWAAMIERHGLNMKPVVRVDPRGDRFDYTAKADEKMLDTVFADLVGKGLRWSVVAGTPVLGPAVLTPIAALGEHDFVGDGLSVRRSGALVFNDVILLAGDSRSRARVDMAGLNLENIVTRDDVFGISNADKEVRQYVRHTGKLRDVLVLDEDTVLHPDAPISIEQLVPSARINLSAFGLLSTMELSKVTVTAGEGQATVAIALQSVNDDLPELLDEADTEDAQS